MIYQIARDAGWTLEYTLRQPHARLVMMLMDAPRYVESEKDKPVRIQSREQLYSVFGKERK